MQIDAIEIVFLISHSEQPGQFKLPNVEGGKDKVMM